MGIPIPHEDSPVEVGADQLVPVFPKEGVSGNPVSQEVREIVRVVFTQALEAKLAAIEAGAQVNPDAAEVLRLWNSNADTNVLTDALLALLRTVPSGANVWPLSKLPQDLVTQDNLVKLRQQADDLLIVADPSDSYRPVLSDEGGIIVFAADSAVGMGLLDRSRDFAAADVAASASGPWAQQAAFATPGVPVIRLANGEDPHDYRFVGIGGVSENHIGIFARERVLRDAQWDYYVLEPRYAFRGSARLDKHITHHTEFEGTLGDRPLAQALNAVQAGDNITIDRSTAGQITIAGQAGGPGGGSTDQTARDAAAAARMAAEAAGRQASTNKDAIAAIPRYAAQMTVHPPNVRKHSDFQRTFQSALSALVATLATDAGATGTRFTNTFRILTRLANGSVVQLHTQGWAFTEDDRQTIPWEVSAAEFNQVGASAATNGIEVWGEFRAVYGGGVDELRGRTNPVFIDFGEEADWPSTRGDLTAEANLRAAGDTWTGVTADSEVNLNAQFVAHRLNDTALLVHITAGFTTATRTYTAGERWYLAPHHSSEVLMVLAVPAPTALTQKQQIGLLQFDAHPSVITYKPSTKTQALSAAIVVTVSNADLLTGDIWYEVEAPRTGDTPFAISSRTLWNATSAITSIDVSLGVPSDFARTFATNLPLDFEFYDAAMDGNLIEAIRLDVALREIGARRVSDKSANYSMVPADFGDTIRLTGATARTFLLPNAAGTTIPIGWHATAKNDSTAILTLDANGLQPIDGAQTQTLAPRESITVQKVADGVWSVLSRQRTDNAIGDAAFSNPPNDLTDAEKKSARDAIDAGVNHQVLASAAAVAWDVDDGNIATLAAAQNFTLAITGGENGSFAILRVLQDATGSRAMTLNSAIVRDGRRAPVLSTAAGAHDNVLFMRRGTTWVYLAAILNG